MEPVQTWGLMLAQVNDSDGLELPVPRLLSFARTGLLVMHLSMLTSVWAAFRNN